MKNINIRSKISPPDAPPTIVAIGDFLLVDPWLDVELDEVPVELNEVPVELYEVPVELYEVPVGRVEELVAAPVAVVPPPVEDVEEDGASCTTK